VPTPGRPSGAGKMAGNSLLPKPVKQGCHAAANTLAGRCPYKGAGTRYGCKRHDGQMSAERREPQVHRRSLFCRARGRSEVTLVPFRLSAPNRTTGPALLPSFSRVSRGFEDLVSEPANAQLDAAGWDGRGVCEADGVVAWSPVTPTTPAACAGTPPGQPHRGGWRSAARRCAGTFFETPPHPRAGGEFILLGVLNSRSIDSLPARDDRSRQNRPDE